MVNRRNFLDDLDEKILSILQKDCRTPLSKIAEICQVSSQTTIKNRIDRLIEEDIIRGFHAHISLETHQEEFDVCLLIAAKIDPKRITDLKRLLTDIPEVWGVYYALGPKNFIVMAKTANQKAFMGHVYQRLMDSHLVTAIETYVIADVVKENFIRHIF